MFLPDDLPILQDLQSVQGTSFSFPFFIGQPTSGYSFSGYLNCPASGIGIVPFVVDNNDLVNGGISINLSSSVTSTLPGGSYPWQFSFTNLQGLTTTWFQGTFAVLSQA